MRKKHSPDKHRGQALIMTTLALIPMFGLLGLAVDLGWMEFTKKSAQTAADAAAMAAVLQYQSTTFSTTITCGVGGVVCQAPTSCSPAPTSYLHSGCDYAQLNGFSSGGNQYVSLAAGVGAPPTATGVLSSARSVELVGHNLAASVGEMSMIRSGDRNTRGISSPRPRTARGRGAECPRPHPRPTSARGEKYFLLTFPLIEPQGGAFSLGPRAISIAHWLVNTHVTAADLA